MNRQLVSLLIAGMVTIAAFGVNQAQAQSTIRIGALYPLSGSMALLGNENLDGARVALEMINERGGVLGKKVEFVLGDASTPDKAQSEAERLISLEGVQIITGTYASGLAYAASQVAERHGAIYWETGSIADHLTERGFKYFFRVTFTGSSSAQLAVDMCKNVFAPKLGKEPGDLRIFIMHEDSDYGTGVGKVSETQGKASGLNIVGREQYKATSTDLSPLILKMKALKPDVIIASSYANDALLIQRQMKQLGVYASAYLGTGGIHGLPDYAQALGTAVNGIIYIGGAATVNVTKFSKEIITLSDEWQRRYTAKHKKAVSFLAVESFLSTYVLLKDVIPVAGGTNPEKVREAALNLNVPINGTVIGWGVQFAKPGAPMAGTNLRAFPTAQQWQNGKLLVVYPESLKMTDLAMVPLPAWDKR